jgi:hypothetical protein
MSVVFASQGVALPYSAFLSGILRLLGTNPRHRLDGVVENLSDRASQPAWAPMSDQELSRAIKELRGSPVGKGAFGREKGDGDD